MCDLEETKVTEDFFVLLLNTFDKDDLMDHCLEIVYQIYAETTGLCD